MPRSLVALGPYGILIVQQAEECTITGTHLPNNLMYNWSLLLLSEDVRCTRVYSLARQHVCYQLTYLSLPLMNTDKHRGVPNWDHVLRTDANAVLCFTCLSVSEKQTILIVFIQMQITQFRFRLLVYQGSVSTKVPLTSEITFIYSTTFRSEQKKVLHKKVAFMVEFNNTIKWENIILQ